jgi:hypothetical protein
VVKVAGHKLDVIFFDDAKADLVISFDAIQFMTGFCQVKEQAAFLVDVAQRDGVGVVVIPADGQDPGGAFFEDRDGFRLGQELLFSSHFAEHAASFEMVQKSFYRRERRERGEVL